MIDYVEKWSGQTKLPTKQLVRWLEIGMSKFYDWKKRHGKINEHNALVPRDHWLEAWEREAILAFHAEHPLEGYRRLTYLMLDADLVAASPATVHRVLKAAGCFARWNRTESRKGTGFQQPLRPHQHWHTDISYVNVCGTFYYLISVLDGCSRYLVHWELRESMQEADVEIVLQRAREAFPGETPRIISDNGPQFVARDFKEFIRLSGMTHVRTSPYYPQSNGKIERWHGTLKRDCLRPAVPLSIEEARTMVARFVAHYNQSRLHSAIGYVTPADKLAGREAAIFAARDEKLAAARERRAARRRQAASSLACEKEHSEEASQGVQRGGNEPPLVCVNANKTCGASRSSTRQPANHEPALNSLTPTPENSISR